MRRGLDDFRRFLDFDGILTCLFLWLLIYDSILGVTSRQKVKLLPLGLLCGKSHWISQQKTWLNRLVLATSGTIIRWSARLRTAGATATKPCHGRIQSEWNMRLQRRASIAWWLLKKKGLVSILSIKKGRFHLNSMKFLTETFHCDLPYDS